MAYGVETKCVDCKKDFFAYISHNSLDAPGLCAECQKKEDDKKRLAHFRKLDMMDMLKRIRRIEAWIYDYKPSTNPLTDIRG